MKQNSNHYSDVWIQSYHTVDEINAYLRSTASSYARIASMISIGTTEEGRPINVIKIGRSNGVTKPSYLIDGGIHAREWISPATVLYFIQRLTRDYGNDASVTQLVDVVDFHLVPVINPDGYAYTWGGNRLWRKNRSNRVCANGLYCCEGTDLNRNFDWVWGTVGVEADNKCSEIYPGASAFSEIEAQSLRDYATSLVNLRGYLTLHSYGKFMFAPYGHSATAYAPDYHTDLAPLAQQALAALSTVRGTTYKFGNGAQLLYATSGGSDDYMKGKLGVKYVYLIELPPSDSIDGWVGFIIDENNIEPIGQETFEAMKVIARKIGNVPNTAGANNVTLTCRDQSTFCYYYTQYLKLCNQQNAQLLCPMSCGICQL